MIEASDTIARRSNDAAINAMYRLARKRLTDAWVATDTAVQAISLFVMKGPDRPSPTQRK